MESDLILRVSPSATDTHWARESHGYEMHAVQLVLSRSTVLAVWSLVSPLSPQIHFGDPGKWGYFPRAGVFGAP